MQKEGTSFWKCWRSKFGSSSQKVQQIDGIVNPGRIADYFAVHFEKICTNNTVIGASRLKQKYDDMRANYCGLPDTDMYKFDASLVESEINNMSRGKAAGLDGLSAEHLQYCHYALPTVLSKLFNLMIHRGYVPETFCQSYTVPLLKGNCNIHSKSLNANDFRGISISPIISKIFEHCILHRYNMFFY